MKKAGCAKALEKPLPGEVRTDASMPVVDGLGEAVLNCVQTGMTVTVREDGAVEMECAGVQAMCAFRGYHFFPFVYSADSLTGDVWEPRILGNLSVDERLHYFALALEIALRI